jgi:hypothetical protein
MTDAVPRVAICAIAKNEGPYLEEWVAYHHLLGFDPIRIYSHESTDASAEVLDRLAAAGRAEWTPWTAPPDKKPQWLAYEDGLRELRGRADWIAFIDLDEFVVLPKHASIQAFLAEHPDLDALAINWRMFGSSGAERHEDGLVIERFTHHAKRYFSGNRAVKTLARVEAIEVPRVHTCTFAPGVVYRTISGEELGPGVGESVGVDHDTIRINHYFTRSREEWDAKAARGRGAKPANDPKKHRTIAEFERNDRNENEEHDLAAIVPRVRAEMAAIEAATHATDPQGSVKLP